MDKQPPSPPSKGKVLPPIPPSTAPEGSRPSSRTRPLSSAASHEDMSRKSPLPPINMPLSDPVVVQDSQSNTAISEDQEDGSRKQSKENISIESKEKVSRQDSRESVSKESSTEKIPHKKPVILEYRRESDQDFGAINSKYSRIFASIEVQTEWSWLEDMKIIAESRPASKASTQGKHKRRSARLSESDYSSDTDALSTDRDEELERVGRGTPSTPGEKKPPSRKSESDLKTIESVDSTPFPQRDDEYGIPTLAVDTDEELSDSESEAEQYKYKGLEEETEEGAVPTLPSIGPPQIIQYQRESERDEEAVDELLQVGQEEQEKDNNQFKGGKKQRKPKRTDRPTSKKTDRPTSRKTDRPMSRKTDRPTSRKTDRRSAKRTDKPSTKKTDGRKDKRKVLLTDSDRDILRSEGMQYDPHGRKMMQKSDAQVYTTPPTVDSDVQTDMRQVQVSDDGIQTELGDFQTDSHVQTDIHTDDDKQTDAPAEEGSDEENVAGMRRKLSRQFHGLVQGVCEFCNNTILPIPTLDQQNTQPPEELYCCSDYAEFLRYTLDHPMIEALNKQDEKIDVRAHASYGSLQDRKEAKARAAIRMREKELAKQMANLPSNKNKDKDGDPSRTTSFFQFQSFDSYMYLGSLSNPDQTAKNADASQSGQKGGAKGGGSKGGGGKYSRGGADSGGTGYNATALSQKAMRQRAAMHRQRKEKIVSYMEVARQMKTVNYMLSSQKCLEEGWTVRPPTPVQEDEEVPEVFEPEPVDPGSRVSNNDVTNKYYQDGSKFVIMFRDGTGSVYYPSGRVAISIIARGEKQYQYIVQDDRDDPAISNILSVFSTDGHGCSFFLNSGQSRLHMDPVYGLELLPSGAKKRRWQWHNQKEHVHAPPIQPIIQALNPHAAIRIQRQDSIILTFLCWKRSARFQIGSTLKVVHPEHYPEQKVDMDEFYRMQVQNKVESLFAKVANLLKFPHSPKLQRLPTPTHLSSRAHKMEKITEEMNTAAEKATAKKKDRCFPILLVN